MEVDKFLEICNNSGESNLVGNVAVGDFELYASKFVDNSDLNGLYWYAGEDKRGSSHWDSSIYPHGNFIFKGKWVYSEYENELNSLHKVYNIDKNNRGVV